MDTDAESVSTAPDKPIATPEEVARGNKVFLHETIPESPRQPSDSTKTPPSEAGALTDHPSHNPDKHVDEEQESVSLQPAEPAPTSPTKENKPARPTAVNGKSKADKPKEPAPKMGALKKTAARPSAISTKTTTTTAKPPAKSPAIKTPMTATHKADPKPAAKTHEKPMAKRETRPASRTGPSATRPTATSVAKKPQPLKTSASETGFIKPKPKSPTKPVHLPPSLMAQTASSGAKGASSRQGRAPANSQTLGVPGRSSSRASAGSSNAKTVKRQPSNISRSRPSLGMPPKKAATGDAPVKKDIPVDEGFLARMMRPTQASSSKTAEKVPTTPPKKQVKRPSTSGSEHRESNVKPPGSAKKPGRKATETVAAPAPKIEEPAQKSTEKPIKEPTKTSTEPAEPAEDGAVEAAKAETVEDAIESTKEASDVPVEVPAEDGAVEAAKAETVEDAVEVTKEASDVQVEAPAESSVVEAAKTETVEDAVEVTKDAEPNTAVEESQKTKDKFLPVDESEEPKTEAGNTVDEPETTKTGPVKDEVKETEPQSELVPETVKVGEDAELAPLTDESSVTAQPDVEKDKSTEETTDDKQDNFGDEESKSDIKIEVEAETKDKSEVEQVPKD